MTVNRFRRFQFSSILAGLMLLNPAIGRSTHGSAGAHGAQATPVWDMASDHLPRLAQQTTTDSATLDELLTLVNAERQQAGIAPLMSHPQLNQVAQRHAEDLAQQGTLSHTGSDGSTIQTRIESVGYSWSAIGENIASGQTSPEAVMASWMSSAGHRKNILNGNFSDLGLGYAEADGQPYWVQVFASPR